MIIAHARVWSSLENEAARGIMVNWGSQWTDIVFREECEKGTENELLALRAAGYCPISPVSTLPLLPPIPVSETQRPPPVPPKNRQQGLGWMAELTYKMSEQYNISVIELLGKSKTRDVVRLRWRIWKACKDNGKSLCQIARYFHKDHSTVMYGIDRFTRGIIPQRGTGTHERHTE